MKNNDIQRIKHIKKYCEDVEKTIQRYGANQKIFNTDIDYINSVSMSIIQIGELSIGLSDDFKEMTKEKMQWSLIRGIRNMFAHTYAKMDKSIIWNVAVKNIPILLSFCEQIIHNQTEINVNNTFQFLEFNDLHDNEIKLVLKSQDQPDYDKGILPRYGFSIVHIKDNEDIGTVYFAVDTTRRQYLRGHLSYGVSPAYSGHNYAMKACKLIKHVALAHGFKRIFIGSEYDNIASRKTIEKLGAIPITINDVLDVEILQCLKTDKINMYVWNLTE